MPCKRATVLWTPNFKDSPKPEHRMFFGRGHRPAGEVGLGPEGLGYLTPQYHYY